MILSKGQKEILDEEYVLKKNVVTKENALEDMRAAIALCSTKNGKYDSIVANKYRDRIAEYGIYCKDEELDNWLSMCQDLIDSIKKMDDDEWLYEAWTVEATAQLMSVMDGDINWDEVNEVVSSQEHTVDSLSEIAQLLIAYSPNGLLFVEHVIIPSSMYSEMRGLKNAYNTEVNRRKRQEKRQRKELGKRLVICLGTRLNELNKNV